MPDVLNHEDDYPWAERVVVIGKENMGASEGGWVCSAHKVCLLCENTLCYTLFARFSVCLL